MLDDARDRIYLVGFMGAGKTTVGRELASALDLPFFDLDDLVESAEGMSIREIFGAHGEPYFRNRERDLLRTTALASRGVIATGGGTFTFRENIEIIQNAGTSVYLAASYTTLRDRIDGTSAERPMFHDEMALHRLYESRRTFYEEADIMIEVSHREAPASVSRRIVAALGSS